MAITLVTTAGASDANAYDTLAFVTSYAETTVWNAAWLAIVAASEETAKALIVRNTFYFDWLGFPGYPTNVDQALKFPRTDVYLPNGSMLDPDTIPTAVKRAWAHLIVYVAGNYGASVDPFTLSPKSNIKSETLGPISKEYWGVVGSTGLSILSTVIAPMMQAAGIGSPGGQVRLVR